MGHEGHSRGLRRTAGCSRKRQITVGNKIVITDSTTIFDDPTALRGANALPVFSPLATYWNVTALVLGGATITGGALDLSTGKEQAAYDLTTVALKTGVTVSEGVPGTASTYVRSEEHT